MDVIKKRQKKKKNKASDFTFREAKEERCIINLISEKFCQGKKLSNKLTNHN